MKKTILLFTFFAFFSLGNKAQTVTDIDGNVYSTVTIGTQVWLGENLKVTHYNNGNSIPNVTDNTAWGNLTTGAYCDYNNDVNNSTTYGRIYNWLAVNDSRNIAPAGWHVPTNDEFTTLINYLGGMTVAGGKLKETGTSHWQSPNTGATNESGFTALPGGERFPDGTFGSLGQQGNWWSTTEVSTLPYYLAIVYNAAAAVTTIGASTNVGFSVRCVRDYNTGMDNKYNLNKINIYPNPATDNINIDFSFKPQSSILTVYDLFGNIKIQEPIVQLENIIYIGALAKGIYFIKISDNHALLQIKLIKK